MLSSEDLQFLNLDREEIEVDLNLNLHFAWESEEFEDDDELLTIQQEDHIEPTGQLPMRFALAASYYRQAAAHSLLIYERERRESIFLQATKAYARIGFPYAFNMATFVSNYFASDLNYIRPLSQESLGNEEISVTESLDQQAQFVYALFANIDEISYRHFDQDEYRLIATSLRERLDEYRNMPIGVLELPLKFYLDLVDTLSTLESRSASIEEALLPVFSRYDITLRIAIENEARWHDITMEFHPAEPDIIGILIRTQSILRRQQREISLLQIIERMPLSLISKTLLRGILSDY